MTIQNKFNWNIGILVLLLSAQVQAYPGESIMLDPVTGDYLITYKSSDSAETRLMQTNFVPATKIVPSIQSTFISTARDVISYRYTISNGVMAKQNIVGIWVENVANPLVGERASVDDAPITVLRAINEANKVATPAPNGWEGDIIRHLSRIAWSTNVGTTFTGGGIRSGQTQSGFGFSSIDLPGVGEAHLEGTGSMFGYPDEGPAEDSAVFAEIERLRDNDFIAKSAAVPTIAVPAPFDAAILLDSIRTHVATWQGKQLVEPVFASQLDRYLVAAADAYRRNQLKAGKEHLETIHEMLEKEHKHLDGDEDGKDEENEHRSATRPNIDRLAARVLDFDLKYVLKRTSKEKERD